MRWWCHSLASAALVLVGATCLPLSSCWARPSWTGGRPTKSSDQSRGREGAHNAVNKYDPVSEHYWVFQTSEDHKYVHMSTVEPLPDGRIAVAFQTGPAEGDDGQSIFFKRSSDGGKTWEPHKVAVKKGFPQAVWGPVLVYNSHAGASKYAAKSPTLAESEEGQLFLFFSASVPANVRGPGRSYPGGDIYLQRSSDFGDTWSTPIRLLEYFSPTRGNVSKVTANKPAVSDDGRVWVLPYWQEKHITNATGPSCAGVLVSSDYGQTFNTTSACLADDAAGWLIENTIAPAKNGTLVQLFRTTEGHIWQSTSSDWGQNWEAPFATPLLNPNSKVFVSALPTSGDLVVTFNPSTTSRTPLQLSISEDSSATWNKFAILDTDRSVAYPTTAYYQEPNATTAGSQDWKILTTYSASTTDGIRIAVTPLPD